MNLKKNDFWVLVFVWVLSLSVRSLVSLVLEDDLEADKVSSEVLELTPNEYCALIQLGCADIISGEAYLSMKPAVFKEYLQLVINIKKILVCSIIILEMDSVFYRMFPSRNCTKSST